MDDYISLLAMTDRGQWILSLELLALAIMLGLGLWRIHIRRRKQEEDQHAGNEPKYDMRRDGQRLSA